MGIGDPWRSIIPRDTGRLVVAGTTWPARPGADHRPDAALLATDAPYPPKEDGAPDLEMSALLITAAARQSQAKIISFASDQLVLTNPPLAGGRHLAAEHRIWKDVA